MEQHQNLPYIEPIVSHHSTQVPISHNRPQRESDGQPSLICGFTLTELANVSIQVAGIIIAAIFGVWAVKSYNSSNDANQLAQAALQQSLYANVLALINLCLSELVSLL
jgi:hypothetical protein